MITISTFNLVAQKDWRWLPFHQQDKSTQLMYLDKQLTPMFSYLQLTSLAHQDLVSTPEYYPTPDLLEDQTLLECQILLGHLKISPLWPSLNT